MPAVNIYFKLHQPYCLRPYTFFDIGDSPFYEDEDNNCDRLLQLARKSFLPTNEALLNMVRKHKGKFRFSILASGVVLDQLEEYAPEVLDGLFALAQSGCVEFLGSTYNHSLSCIFSPEQFSREVQAHSQRILSLFKMTPKVFCNTELIYHNSMAPILNDLGFTAAITEGADHVLGWRSPNYLYQAASCKDFKVLLRNYSLSDDVSLRFSDTGWESYPLTADKYASWICHKESCGEVVNIYLPYSTFGKKHEEASGIFQFLQALPENLLEFPHCRLTTASESLDCCTAKASLDVSQYVSCANAERDLNLWLGNDMQQDALQALYLLEDEVLARHDPDLLKVWQRLTCSNHFSYMSTRWFADGGELNIYNPYDSPYDAYINFMNVLADFTMRLREERVSHIDPLAASIKAPVKTKAPAKAKAKAKTEKGV